MSIAMKLSDIDTHFFFWINQGQRNPFFDRVMPYITEFDHWRVPILVGFLLLFLFGGKKTRIALAMTALLVGALDYSNSFYIKHYFVRPRPCNVLTGIHTFGICPKSFSFPSNHAANIFGAAFFLSYIFRPWAFFLIPTAVAVGYSRVYVGEHYPFDVLAGALLGALVAGLFLFLFTKIMNLKLKSDT